MVDLQKRSLLDYLLDFHYIFCTLPMLSQDITTTSSHLSRFGGQKTASHNFMDILDYIKFWCDAKKVPFYIPIPGTWSSKQA